MVDTESSSSESDSGDDEDDLGGYSVAELSAWDDRDTKRVNPMIGFLVTKGDVSKRLWADKERNGVNRWDQTRSPAISRSYKFGKQELADFVENLAEHGHTLAKYRDAFIQELRAEAAEEKRDRERADTAAAKRIVETKRVRDFWQGRKGDMDAPLDLKTRGMLTRLGYVGGSLMPKASYGSVLEGMDFDVIDTNGYVLTRDFPIPLVFEQ